MGTPNGGCRGFTLLVGTAPLIHSVAMLPEPLEQRFEPVLGHHISRSGLKSYLPPPNQNGRFPIRCPDLPSERRDPISPMNLADILERQERPGTGRCGSRSIKAVSLSPFSSCEISIDSQNLTCNTLARGCDIFPEIRS